MIVYCSKERKKRRYITHKPYLGCFYSQLTYDTILTGIAPRMTEEELRRHIFFGNLPQIQDGRIRHELSVINESRGDLDRNAEYFE